MHSDQKEDEADKEEYVEELRREMFERDNGTSPEPRQKKRRMWSPAHKQPHW